MVFLVAESAERRGLKRRKEEIIISSLIFLSFLVTIIVYVDYIQVIAACIYVYIFIYFINTDVG